MAPRVLTRELRAWEKYALIQRTPTPGNVRRVKYPLTTWDALSCSCGKHCNWTVLHLNTPLADPP